MGIALTVVQQVVVIFLLIMVGFVPARAPGDRNPSAGKMPRVRRRRQNPPRHFVHWRNRKQSQVLATRPEREPHHPASASFHLCLPDERTVFNSLQVDAEIWQIFQGAVHVRLPRFAVQFPERQRRRYYTLRNILKENIKKACPFGDRLFDF